MSNVNLSAQTPAPGPWLDNNGIPNTANVFSRTNSALNVNTTDNWSWINLKYCDKSQIGQIIHKLKTCTPPGGVNGPTDVNRQGFGAMGTWSPVDPGDPGSEVDYGDRFYSVPYLFLNSIDLSQLGSNIDVVFVDHFGNPTSSIAPEKPLLWLRTESQNQVTSAVDVKSRFIVMPNGFTGINAATPRGPLDVNGAGLGRGLPIAYFGVRSLGSTFTSPGNNAVHYTQHLQIVPRCGQGSFNNISQSDDVGIFFTDGKGTDGTNPNGSNASAGFVIAPWSSDPNMGGMRIANNGNIEMRGDLRAPKVTVNTKWWPDFVFKPSYNLMSLDSLSNFIAQNGHLPRFESEEEVKKNGANLGETQAKQQQTIEELTLYTLQQDSALQQQKVQLQTQAAQIEAQGKKQAELESLVNQLLEEKKK